MYLSEYMNYDLILEGHKSFLNPLILLAIPLIGPLLFLFGVVIDPDEGFGRFLILISIELGLYYLYTIFAAKDIHLTGNNILIFVMTIITYLLYLPDRYSDTKKIIFNILLILGLYIFIHIFSNSMSIKYKNRGIILKRNNELLVIQRLYKDSRYTRLLYLDRMYLRRSTKARKKLRTKEIKNLLKE